MNMTKKILLGIVTLLLSLSFTSCVLTPADYCEKVLDLCGELKTCTTDFAKIIGSKDIDKIQKTYDSNLKKINETLAELQEMGDCKGNKDLVEAGIKYAEFYKKVYEEDYSLYIEILKKDHKTEYDGGIVAATMGEIEKESLKAEQNLLKNFSKFVEEFGLIPTSN